MMTRLRSFTAAAALLLLPAAASAQATSSPVFAKGTRLLSVGFVTGNDLGTGFGGQVEFGVYNFTNRLSLGIGAAASYSTNDVGFGLDVKYLPITAIGNVHLSIAEQPKLDLYGGLSLGIGNVDIDCEGVSQAFCDGYGDSDTIFGAQVGARYAITPRVLVMGQLGLSDIPLLTAGVTFKF